MNIAVTGSSGFLGKKFIDLYGDNFDAVIKLNSKKAPLNDKVKMISMTKKVKVIVHFAFDHEYKSNIIGIRNILEACKVNGISKLIFISSVSVYDPFVEGSLNEGAKYSKLYEPYSMEKQNIEKLLEKEKNEFLDILMLQPSIVYGIGGNWSKFIFNSLKTDKIFLPNKGRAYCNAVYVNDVAQAVYMACVSKRIKKRRLRVLVSGEKAIKWSEFYQLHHKLLIGLNLPSQFSINDVKKLNKYSGSSLKNIIFYLWYETPTGLLFNYFISALKKIRSKKFVNTSKIENFITFIKSDIKDGKSEPLGITYTNHNINYQINIDLSKNEIGYSPKYDANLAFNEIGRAHV